jgi:hypothetical protein
MGEGQPPGVEELTGESQVARDAVDGIPGYGKLDRSEMDADLVGAAGLEADAKERMPAEELGELEVRDSLSRRRRVERDARGVATVAADRRLDAPVSRARAPAHERHVLTDELPATEKALEPPVRLVRAGDDE